MKLHRCSYGRFSHQQIIGPVTWSFFDLLVVHQGQIEINIAHNAHYKLTRGEALLIYPNSPFSGKVLSETSLASVQHFSLSSFEHDFSLPYLAPYETCSNGAKHYVLDNETIADIERGLSYNQTLLPEAYVEAMQVNLLHLVLAQLTYKKHAARSSTKYKEQFNQLLDSYIKKPEQSLKIEDMAAQINLSPSHFRAEFFKFYGQPPQRYLLAIKMKAACQLLEKNQLPIKTISASLGYEDISCFYRHFKKLMATTPALYRQKIQIIG